MSLSAILVVLQVSAARRSLMETCSGQGCLPQKSVEETSLPSAPAFLAEDSEAESVAWRSASASLESTESLESVTSHGYEVVSCDAMATLEAAPEQHDESMDEEENAEEGMSSTVAVEEFGSYLRDDVGKQTVDPIALTAQPSLGSMSAQGVANAKHLVSEDAMGLEEVMRTAASDRAPESLLALELIHVVDALATTEAMASEAAESGVAMEASIDAEASIVAIKPVPSPESVPQANPVADVPQTKPSNSPPPRKKHINPSEEGPPVVTVNDPRPDLVNIVSAMTPHTTN